MSDVLFEIKKENLETGLRGYPCGYCTTSDVDPMQGLSYIDIPVKDLALWQPERVIYLLYHGREGSTDEVKTFAKELQQRSTLHPA
jgi:citrate synthase